jgi:RNA polymerase sigma factor (sigma-70 family)
MWAVEGAVECRGHQGAIDVRERTVIEVGPSFGHPISNAPNLMNRLVARAYSAGLRMGSPDNGFVSKSGGRRHSRVESLDDQEWDRALEACYARVLRALIGTCGSRERAEDGLQDALLAAWKPGTREHVQRPDAWLYRVALRAIGRARWRRRFEVRLTEDARHGAEPSLDRVSALELLRKLTPRQREFVVARYFLDLSYREIAEQWAVSVSGATSTVAQALARLRRDLEKGEDRWMRKSV